MNRTYDSNIVTFDLDEVIVVTIVIIARDQDRTSVHVVIHGKSGNGEGESQKDGGEDLDVVEHDEVGSWLLCKRV